MKTFPDYEHYDALGLAALVHGGKVTPLELLESAIALVEARNPKINAVVMRLYDYGRKQIAVGQAVGDLLAPVVVEAHDDGVDLWIPRLDERDGGFEQLERRHLAAVNERGQPERVVVLVVGECLHGPGWWPSRREKSSARRVRNGEAGSSSWRR